VKHELYVCLCVCVCVCVCRERRKMEQEILKIMVGKTQMTKFLMSRKIRYTCAAFEFSLPEEINATKIF
jgi:hypothetical protein